jgi:hypothetical protein
VKIAKEKYGNQKFKARKRKIAWNINFNQWYDWWLAQGVDKNQHNSYKGKHLLCMCRYNDTGPYSLDNIYCATKSQNSKDANPNLHNLRDNSKKLQTPDGVFASRAEAARHYNLDPAAIFYRIKRNPDEWFYL